MNLNPLEIINAWIISFNPTPEQKKLAEERLKTCKECPQMKLNKIFNIYLCNSCVCPIHKKIFSKLNNCPKKSWQN